MTCTKSHPGRAAAGHRPVEVPTTCRSAPGPSNCLGEFSSRTCYSAFANREYRMAQPSLRPQDVVVLAKLLSHRGSRPPMAQMGTDLKISSSEVHAALKRLALARLVSSDADGNRPLPDAVEEFLIHGFKYAFPAKRGEVTRGVPT